LQAGPASRRAGPDHRRETYLDSYLSREICQEKTLEDLDPAVQGVDLAVQGVDLAVQGVDLAVQGGVTLAVQERPTANGHFRTNDVGTG
jgi:hypothetical protein